ncbi:MAG: hypothetical protein Q8R98_09965 [Rubrivivax sp.]|nr:hypothetical protein [Rubrivivax sp.]
MQLILALEAQVNKWCRPKPQFGTTLSVSSSAAAQGDHEAQGLLLCGCKKLHRDLRGCATA